MGKLTLAALEPVLALYRAPEFLADRLTTLRLLTRRSARSRRWPNDCAARWRTRPVPLSRSRPCPCTARSAAALCRWTSCPATGWRRAIAAGRPGRHLDRLEAALRGLPVPVIGRIADDALWLDLRCLEARDEVAFAAQLAEPIL